MLKKKLLTIAGVLGILACGACFLPPIHTGPPAPPPPPRPIQIPADVQAVRVVVIDNSIPAQIDTQSIAASVADFINRTRSGHGIAAHAGKEAADADLEIAIAGENATLIKAWPSDGTESWSFSFRLTVLLVRNGNKVVSQRPNLPVQFQVVLPPQHPADVWSIPEVRQACISNIEIGATRGIVF
jgi:hypothetical protein